MTQQQGGKSPVDFVGENARVFEVFLSHHTANKHKMEPIPVCNIPDHLL
jgi:NAD+ synthase